MRNCCAITGLKPEEGASLNNFLSDMFEHIYSNEIVMTKDIAEELKESEYHLDYLGEKNFKTLGIAEELYKVID